MPPHVVLLETSNFARTLGNPHPGAPCCRAAYEGMLLSVCEGGFAKPTENTFLREKKIPQREDAAR